MREKLTTLEKAASAVKSGAKLVMSANLQRAPMAFLRQLVRQGTKDLRVVGVVGGDLNIDFLVGANSVAVVDTCSVTLGEFARTGPNFSRYVTGGRVRSLDNTWGVLFSQAQAGSMGVPYVPIVGLVGTDLLKRRDDMVIAPNPFEPSVKTVVAKSLRPDVAVFHAQMGDRFGNVSFGYEVEAVMLAEASKHVIVTVERIVDHVLTEKESKGAFMPQIHVNDVVHAPYGAHPAGCVGVYGPDKIHMREYVIASRDDAAFAQYVNTHVHEVANHEEYVDRFVPLEWKQTVKVSGS